MSIKQSTNQQKGNLMLVGSVQAGFPAPGDEFGALELNISDLLIQNPLATYFMRVRGQSMQGMGIFDGDLVVIDRSLTPKRYDVVVAQLDDAFTLKQLSNISNTKISLEPANNQFKTIAVNGDQELQIWGVVVHVIHSLRKGA